MGYLRRRRVNVIGILSCGDESEMEFPTGSEITYSSKIYEGSCLVVVIGLVPLTLYVSCLCVCVGDCVGRFMLATRGLYFYSPKKTLSWRRKAQTEIACQ